MDLSWDCTGEWDLKGLALEEADLVLGNMDEVMAVSCRSDLEEAMASLKSHGVGTLIVKQGDQGARVVTATGDDWTVPAFAVDPVNATGTGDVFNGALLVALSEGRTLEDAVRFACAAGAIRVAGGCHTFPSREEVEALMAGK